MIGRVPIKSIDRHGRNELLDIDDARRLDLHVLKVFLVEQHVFALGEFEAFHEIAARQLLAGAGVDGFHLDAVVGSRIDPC